MRTKKQNTRIKTNSDSELVDAAVEERLEFERFYAEINASPEKAIEIPYSVSATYVTFSGIFYLREPFENSSTKGVVSGVVNGTYSLDRRGTNDTVSDPLRRTKWHIKLDFKAKQLHWKFCRKDWKFKWKCSKWKTISL